MQRMELKRIVEFFWKGALDRNKEKVPLSSKTLVKDNGSIPKESSTLVKQDVSESIEEKDDEESRRILGGDEELGPMSALRKLCFFLSLNVGVLYVLTFAWLLPCNEIDCPRNYTWKSSFKNIEITTDLDTSKDLGMVFFGYARENDNQSEGHLAVLDMSTGHLMWNKTLDFLPLSLFCSLPDFDANRDGIGDCLVSGEDTIVALNASDGYLFWQQRYLPREIGSVSPVPAPYQCKGSKDFPRIALGRISRIMSSERTEKREDITLIVLDGTSGRRLLSVPTPCEDLPLRIVPWTPDNDNETQMSVMCRLNRSVQLWNIPSELICGTETSKEYSGSEKYFHVSRLDGGSIVSADDVTPVVQASAERGLLLGWTDTVTMVTNSALGGMWRTVLNGSEIMFMLQGRFTSTKHMEVAVASRDQDSNITINVLETSSGNATASESIGNGRVTSLWLLPGKKDEVDSVVVETEMLDVSSSFGGTIVIHEDAHYLVSNRTYHLVKFGIEKTKTKLFSISSVYGSTVGVNLDGEAVLLTSERVANETFSVSGHHLNIDKKRIQCWK